MSRQRVFIAAVLLILCAVSHSMDAAIFDWNNIAGGTFSTPANWSPSGPPNSNDTARFSLPNTYTITLNNATTVNTLTQTQGHVTVNLNNNVFLPTTTTNNSMGAAGLTSSLSPDVASSRR